jgi:hypothetical protein
MKEMDLMEMIIIIIIAVIIIKIIIKIVVRVCITVNILVHPLNVMRPSGSEHLRLINCPISQPT